MDASESFFLSSIIENYVIYACLSVAGLPWCLRWLKKKKSASNAGDSGLIPGLGRSPGEGDGYPLQYSCLENPVDRGAWWSTVHGVVKGRTQVSD